MSMSDYINRPQVLYIPFREIVMENPVLKKGEIVVAYEDYMDNNISNTTPHTICMKVGDGVKKFNQIQGTMLAQPNHTNETFYGHKLITLTPSLNYVEYDKFWDTNDEEYTSIATIDLFSNFGMAIPPTDGISTYGISFIDDLSFCFNIRWYGHDIDFPWMSYVVDGSICGKLDGTPSQIYPSVINSTTLHCFDTSANAINIDLNIKTELCQTQYYQFYKFHIVTGSLNSFKQAFSGSAYFDINIY